MAAPSPAPTASLNLENDDIHGRLQAFLSSDPGEASTDPETGEAPLSPAPPAPEAAVTVEETSLLADPEAEAEATAASEVGAAAPEAAEGEDAEDPHSEEGIVTLADMAMEFGMAESDLLNHLQVDGPTGRVSLGDALATFQHAPESARRWADIASAEQRLTALDQSMQQEHGNTARELAAHTSIAIEVIQEEFKDIDWGMLEREDPTRYLILKQRQGELHAKVAGAVDRLKQLEASRAQQLAQVTSGTREQEMAALHAKMPDWREPRLASQAINEIQNFLVQSGFTQDEMNQLQDHRFLLVAYQAAKYHQLQDSAPKTIEKLRRLPSTRGALKAGARRVEDRTAAQKLHSKRVQTLQNTGDERAAAALIEGLL